MLNLGELPLQWTAESNSAVVSLDPPFGTGPTEVVVTANAFDEASTATITVHNVLNAADVETVLVQLRPDLAPGDLEVSANLFLLTETAPSATFNILNAGEAPFAWSITSDTPELLIEPRTGTGPATITVAATGFTEDAKATLTVTNADAPGDTETVIVRVRHTPLPAVLALSARLIELTKNAPTATFDVQNRGDVPLQWEVSCDSDLVHVDPAWGKNGATVTVSATDFSKDAAVAVTVENSTNPADADVVMVSVKKEKKFPAGCYGVHGDGEPPLRNVAGDLLLTIAAAGALFATRKRARM